MSIINSRLIQLENATARAQLYPEGGFQLFGFQVKHAGSWLETIHAPLDVGKKPRPRDERDQQIHSLEAEIAKLRSRAEKAELLVALQKKVSEILGIALPEPNKMS